MNRTAILIDGGFFVKRAIKLWGKKTPEELAKILQDYCNRHIKQNKEDYHQLYRIFYYDCPPINKKLHHPLTNRLIDYAKTEQYEWRLAFHEQLRKLRKMALRLGHLDEEGTNWNLDPRLLRVVITGRLPISKLREEDFILNTKQKGVDMRIGVDIASMAYKKQVEQMILIAGDSDFVPAAKLARREGIDFILDPLWAQIKPDLFEHIDGLRTVCEKPLSGGDSFEDAGSKAEMGYDDGEDEDSLFIPLLADLVETPTTAQVPVAAAISAAVVAAAAVQPTASAQQAAPVAPVKKPSRRRSAKPKAAAKPQENPAGSSESMPAPSAPSAQPAAPTQPAPSAPQVSPASAADGEVRPASSRSASRRRRRSNKSAATAAAAAGAAEPKETPAT